MKLLYASPSPFSRKVRVFARELGIADHIEEVPVHTTPLAPAQEVGLVNPLFKIPTLIADDGLALFDSRVICAYLQSRADRARGPEHLPEVDVFKRERRHALADGILDAGLLCRYEGLLRPAAFQWTPWIDAQRAKILAGLKALDSDPPAPSPVPSIDAIAMACTLGWLEFRLPDIPWRTMCPSLVSFYEQLSARESMQATRP